MPVSVQSTIQDLGHVVEYIRDFVPPGSPDPIVATVTEELEYILVSFDGDFQKIAPKIPEGHRARFRRLCRIWMRCSEPQAAQRFQRAFDLIELEHDKVQTGALSKFVVWIGKSWLRTER